MPTTQKIENSVENFLVYTTKIYIYFFFKWKMLYIMCVCLQRKYEYILTLKSIKSTHNYFIQYLRTHQHRKKKKMIYVVVYYIHLFNLIYGIKHCYFIYDLVVVGVACTIKTKGICIYKKKKEWWPKRIAPLAKILEKGMNTMYYI